MTLAMNLAPLPGAIVDAHHHFWDLNDGRFPWLQAEYDAQAFFLGDYTEFCKDFGPREYRARTQGYPVVATVHVEAERARDEALEETRWLHAQHQLTGLPSAVVAYVDFSAENAAERLAEHARYPLVRGIRCKPRTSSRPDVSIKGEPGTMQDPQWLAGLASLGQLGWSWDLRVPFWHLEEAAQVAAQVPDIPIVLNHAGLPWDRSADGLAHWRRGMQALAKHDHVHVKLSELGLRDTAWDTQQNAAILREVIEIFDPRRCMFASNLPVSGLKVGFTTLMDTMRLALYGLPDEAQQYIWYDTARRFYRLPTDQEALR